MTDPSGPQAIAKEGAHGRYLLHMKIHRPIFGPPDFPKLVRWMKVELQQELSN